MIKTKEADILIAEDDTVIARLQKFNLEKLVSRPPVICTNGKIAVEHLDDRETINKPVLVILDLNMPVMNGLEFLNVSSTKPYTHNVYVVVVTSSLFKEDRRMALEYEHVIGYYIKPLNKEHFREILQLPQIREFFTDQLIDNQ